MKSEIRRTVREALHAMSQEDISLSSLKLCRCIAYNEFVKRANVVALFSSLSDEPCTAELIEVLSKKHTIVLPRVCGDAMDFYPYSKHTLSVGSYGILEPQHGIPVSVAEIDVIVVPGVAFTKSGIRLGRGKGFYDKYMSQKEFRAHKIGVCFSCQFLDELPCDVHDVLMDEVVVL